MRPAAIAAILEVPFVSLLTPPARRIDPRGQRFGAGVSAVVLLASFVLGLPWLAVLVGLNLVASAGLGTRAFLPSRLWPAVRSGLRLGPPAELEHEYPPRFAQALGAACLAAAAIAFALGATALGWMLVAAVATLQAILAATGICVGCRLYFLRWWLPVVVARLFRRADELVGSAPVTRIRYTDH